MTDLKRFSVKYIRDKVKSNYKRDLNCRICGTDQMLELHHYNSVAELYNKWAKDNDLSHEDVLEHRDDFISLYWAELVELCVTLCNQHHTKLHKVYGKSPKLVTAPKQQRWVEKQREKAQE